MNLAFLYQALCFGLILASSCEGDALWNRFATSPSYANLRLVTNQSNFFNLLYLSKGLSLVQARMDCSRECASNDTCQAFNSYDNAQSYICERLPQKLCNNQKSRAVITVRGSSIWEKLTGGTSTVCFDLSSNVSCEVVRPGCNGIWPNCFKCVKHCIDCYNRYGYSGYRNYTFWPDGDVDSSMPVFATCKGSHTYVFNRAIDMSTGIIVQDYRMLSNDIFRLTSLQAYKNMGFWFGDSNTEHYSVYSDPITDANGTLLNISFSYSYPSGFDIFMLNDHTVKSAPFVDVGDDRYGCGSFWLLDPNNATYCPGGGVSLFGTPQIQVNPFKVLRSGICWPTFTRGAVLTYGCLSLF